MCDINDRYHHRRQMDLREESRACDFVAQDASSDMAFRDDDFLAHE